MKVKTTFLTRCLSWVLVLMLLVSSANLGTILHAHADESEYPSKSFGELVAENYELTDAEKDLLKSGLLAGGKVTFVAPTTDANSDLVDINTDEKLITAGVYTDVAGKKWIPVSAQIKVGDAVKETVDLADGKGNYVFAENAFSVAVTYQLTAEVDADVQTTLLSSAAWLKNGVAILANVAEQAGNLYILEQAMPELVALVNNGVSMQGGGSIPFPEEQKAAILALDAQMTANGGKLNLSVMIEEHDAALKTEYLLTKGADMQAEVKDSYNKCNAISTALNTFHGQLALFISLGMITQAQADQIDMLAKVCGNLVTGLESAKNAEWTAAEKGTALVADGVDYAKLDALVAALGETTALPTIVNPLPVAEAVISKNLSMFNVTVNVELYTTVNNAEKLFGSKSVVLTLHKGATKADILAAIEESDIVADAKTSWGVAFVADKYAETTTALPEVLEADVAYVVTYKPVEYTLTLGYGETKVVPYGYVYTLPVHADAAQAYDYKVNGVAYPQGTVITVADNTEITRSEGKSYDVYDLYTVVANNFGNDVAKAILSSGALFGTYAIPVREPDPAEAETLLKLQKGKLTAEDYLAAYAGLSWKPYTYGVEGTENFFSGNEATGIDGKEVKMQYRLLLEGITEAEAQAILDLAANLKSEADAQKSTLDAFAGYYDTMGQLDKTKLGALNGVIDVTDFTPGDGTDTDADNLALRAYFKSVVGGIIANNLDANNQLKIYNMLGEYKVDGLRYYYNNSAALIAEINALAGYLGQLMDEEEALKIMVSAAGFPEYAEKIADLEGSLATVQTNLKAPNAAIDLNSKNLGKLLDALVKEGAAAGTAKGNPYLLSQMMTAMSDDQVNVQIVINTPKGNTTVTTPAQLIGTKLTQKTVNELLAAAEAKVAELLGENVAFYDVEKGELPAVGAPLDEKTSITWVYSVKEYTVKIEGEADQIVTINDSEINLPKHPTNGFRYEYTIGEVSKITASTYTFTAAELTSLFVDGSYTIVRVTINEAAEKLETAFGDWLVWENGEVVAVAPVITADQAGIMDFVMTLVNSGYSYIAVDGKPLMYMNAEDSLEICVQALLDAFLNDETFNSDKVIALGDGAGEVLKSTITIGNDAATLFVDAKPFSLNVTGLPGAMATVAQGLEAIKPYMTFQAGNGTLDIKLDIPEKVYEVYLTALLATGYVEKEDIAAVNSEIAFQFLWDYVEMVLNTEADAISLTNTLKMLGIDKSLAGYNDYYLMVKRGLQHPGVSINPEDEDGDVDLSVTANFKTALDAAISKLGVDLSAYETYLAMIKEYKGKGVELSVAANAVLADAGTAFEALYVDVKVLKDGVKKGTSGVAEMADGVNYTVDATELKNIKEQGAMILLSDVEGDLVFNGTTGVLDLNGQNVNGNIVANGKLFIIDSSLAIPECGVVTGSVSGNAVILGGKYVSKAKSAYSVSAFLRDGYVQDADGSVHNALYTVEGSSSDLIVNVNTDILDEGIDSYTAFAKALAVDIAVDMVMNYYNTAALSADGNTLYALNFNDLIGLLAGDKVDGMIERVLQCFDVPGMSDFVNIVLADILDFAAIEAAAQSDEKIFATYALSTAPWMVSVEHVADGDYLTFGIAANQKQAKNFNVSLKLSGSKVAYVEKLAGKLDEIVNKAEITVDVKQPVYDAAANKLSIQGSANAEFILDLADEDKCFVTIIAVALANGGSAQAADLVAALNAGDMDALKDAFDKVTAAEVFTALKALNRGENFAALVEKVGVTVDTEYAAKLESKCHLLLCAIGKALEVLDVTGPSKAMGGLDKDDNGQYDLSGLLDKAGTVSARGYSAFADLAASGSLSVILFELCYHEEAIVKGYPATCTEDGLTDGKICSKCGKVLVAQEVIPAKGHTSVVVKGYPATCTEDGLTDGAKCSVCGEVLVAQEVIPAKGHTEMVLSGKPATCTETGLTEGKICSVCGEILVAQEVIPVAGHTSQVVKGYDATCTEDGLTDGAVCSVCGEVLVAQTVIPAAGHIEAIVKGYDATCTKDGLTDGKICAKCGEVLVAQTVIPAKGHTEVVVKGHGATCTEDGLTDGVQCGECGEWIVKQEVIPAAGHVPGAEWQADEDGHWHICSVCGEKCDEAGHTFVANADKTMEKCSVCGFERKIKTPQTGDYDLTTYVAMACISFSVLAAALFVFKRKRAR